MLDGGSTKPIGETTMQAQERHSKGTVAIIVSNNRLQLRFNYLGKRQYLSLGFSDTQTNRKLAEMRARQIELDILSGNFDVSLEKYKFQAAPNTVTPVTPILSPPKTSLVDLWEKYTEFQQQHLEESTIIRDYNKIEKRIRKFPAPHLEDAIEIQSYLLKKFAPETAKRTLEQLSACCRWAIRKKLISENPFLEMSKEIKTKKTSRVSRKPFSRECVEAILSAFEKNTYTSKYSRLKHSYYLPYVKFLFLTGCRPEEAIALKWKHIEQKQIYICEAMPTDVRVRKATKTSKPRYFPINEELRILFDSVRLENYDSNALVFPSINGREINAHNFLNRIWKPIVKQLVKEGKVKEYLPQYNCRHTFITLCLEDGISSRRVSEWCGTSVTVIETHYAGVIQNIQVPSFGLGLTP